MASRAGRNGRLHDCKYYCLEKEIHNSLDDIPLLPFNSDHFFLRKFKT